jgi:hypothetical protein
VRSGTAQKAKDTQGVMNAMNFPVTTLTISPWLLVRRLFSGLSRIDERSELKDGFKMKKPAIFVQHAVIKFSGAL